MPRLKPRTFAAGETIVYRGDPGVSMFMLTSGSVTVNLINAEGAEYTIATLSAGISFHMLAQVRPRLKVSHVAYRNHQLILTATMSAFLLIL